MSPRFSALAIGNFRIYLSGAFLSNVGTWMQRVAQDWLVLAVSHGSTMAVGVTTALQFAPTLLVSPYGGVLADRFDKRKILALTQTWMAVCAGLLGGLAIAGGCQTWHVYLMAFLFGVGAAVDVPARQSFVSEIVPREQLPNAIGLNSASFNAARLLGPGLAGLVIARFGTGWAIIANALSYFAFLAALVRMDPQQLRPTPRVRAAKGQVREGIAYVRGHPDLLLIVLIAFFVGTFAMNFQMTMAIMAAREFHRGPAEYGLLGSLMAIGSLTGALVAAGRRQAPSQRFIIAITTAFGALVLIAGLMPNYWAFGAFLPVVGLVALLALPTMNTAVQLGAAPQVRSRVLALYMMVLMGGTPLGAPLLGWLGELFGPRWTLIGGGMLTLIGIAASVYYVRRLRPRPAQPVSGRNETRVPTSIVSPLPGATADSPVAARCG